MRFRMLLFPLFLLSSLSSAFAATSFEARINPEFLEFMQKSQSAKSQLAASSSSGHKTGYNPSPVDHRYAATSRMKVQSALRGTYPTSYDLRNYSKLTAIRDQSSCGACWAFASYSSAESTLLTGETWDFSEQNMRNLSGFDWEPCDGGGNIDMATAYLVRRDGPVLETADPYNTGTNTSVTGLPVQKLMTNVIYLPTRTSYSDNDAIKYAVTTYGAVYTTMYMDASTSYCNMTTGAYYYNGSETGNHAIAIVGWNDSYAASNFRTVPPGPGAFIMRNSWGTGYGDSGYFYVSYYDTQFAYETNAVVLPGISTGSYKSVYGYDKLGWIGSMGADDIGLSASTTFWGGNIFSAASGNEKLSAVGFYTTGPDTSYTVYVYTDPTSTPVSGTEVAAARVSGSFAYSGYHTVALPSSVSLSIGQRFAVVVKLTNSSSATYPQYPLAVEYKVSGYSGDASIISDVGYVSADGSAWTKSTDISGFYHMVGSGVNVSVKAYTTAKGPNQVTVYDGAVQGQESSVTTHATQLSANWSDATGTSAISRYLVAVGTSLSNLNGVKDWTSVGTSTSVTITGLSLTNRTTYYVSVVAEDADLFRSTSTSAGQMTKFDASYSIALNSAVAPKGPLAVTVTADQQLMSGGLTVTVQQSGASAAPVTMATTDNLTYTGTYQVVTDYDGQATVVAVGTTTAGYTTSSTTYFTVDTTSPTAAVAIGGSLPLNSGSYTATLTVTDASSISGTPTLRYYRDGTSSPVYTVPLSLSSDKVWTGALAVESYTSDGQYDFSFSATDAAGNVGTQLVSGSTFTVKTSITNGSGGSITNSDGTQVVLPAYAYAGGVSGTLISIAISTPSLSLSALAAANAAALQEGNASPLSGTGSRNANLNRLFVATETLSGVVISTFLADVTIRIPYDVDSLGYVAGTQFKETTLRLFSLDESTRRWVLVPSTLDTSSTPHAITAAVRHFSIYGVLGVALTQDFSSVLVYPNPCDMKQVSAGVTIANLPSAMTDLTIRIYNLAGELVRTLSDGSGISATLGSRKAVWDGRNSSGDKVASGMYLYVAKGTGGKKAGKIGIIW